MCGDCLPSHALKDRGLIMEVFGVGGPVNGTVAKLQRDSAGEARDVCAPSTRRAITALMCHIGGTCGAEDVCVTAPAG